MTDPFLKWPGGKRWLVQAHAGLFACDFVRLVEPFVGGGAVFFALQPTRALLADANAELINAYACVRDNADAITRRLGGLQARHSPETYYRVRGEEPNEPLDRAVRFIYLNRTCFNGLYRVNRQGKFNVPIGSKTTVQYPTGFLREVSAALQAATLRVADFEDTIDSTGRGDLVFADPPYTVMHNTNNFVKYNAHLFSWADQERLAAALKRAHRRGASVVVANGDHESVRALYRGFGQHRRLSRATVLSADPAHRKATTEFLVTNFR